MDALPPAAGSETAGPDHSGSSEIGSSRRRMGLKKRVLFALAPALLLSLSVELTLRATGFEFRPWMIDQDILRPDGDGFLRTARHYRENEPYGFPFCVDQRISARKPAGTCRVILAGGSSVMRLGAAEVLQQQLERMWQQPVEIVNFGVSAGHSARVERAVEEALRLEPDLIVVYSGHNDLLPLMSPGRGPRLRTVQWLTRLGLQWFQPRNRIRPLQELAPAPRDEYYQQFQQNLTSIVRSCQFRQTPIVLGVPASNLMWPPRCLPGTATKPAPGTSRERLEELLRREPENPFVAFELAQRFYWENKYGRARELFETAILHDNETGRADRVIQQICRDTAAAEHVPLADISQALDARATGRIPGELYFDDWCHLNEFGNRILQLELARIIQEVLHGPASPADLSD